MSHVKDAITFHEGGSFRVLLAPTRLDGDTVFLADVISFDVRVYDRDAVRPARVNSPIFELLGADPAATNPSGSAYFSASYRTDAEWTSGGKGYSFDFAVYSPLWSSVEGGHTYAVEFTFSTLQDGQVFYPLIATAAGSHGE